MTAARPERTEVDEALAWRLLLAIKRWARAGADHDLLLTSGKTADGSPGVCSREASTGAPATQSLLAVSLDGTYEPLAPMTPAAGQLLDLHLPFALACESNACVLGHLGQSLDGRIATESGASHYINGPENITHLHRLRALADAVIVGWRTVLSDNPRLTVRHVEGDNPLRVVIDPGGQIPDDCSVVTDGAAPTLIVGKGSAGRKPSLEHLSIEAESQPALAEQLVGLLRARGCVAVFVEGGGRTVSAFLQAGLLDRLQIAVAPMIIGSGIPAVALPPIDCLEGALRPACRTFDMGNDVLFDLDLRN